MLRLSKHIPVAGLLALLAVLAIACAGPEPVLETIVETVIVTQKVEGETVELVITATPEPTQPPETIEEGPRTLFVCMGQEPDTLYPYGGTSTAIQAVLSAVYDGPIDRHSFDYKPVILEKIPSLADGDAIIQPVGVALGDLIVDDGGSPVVLGAGVIYRPSGCNSPDCAVEYLQGDGPVTVDQMVVTFRLLPGLQWSDGNPLTASDSLYSFGLAADPDTPVGKHTIERTESYEALDDITVAWTGLPGYLDPDYRLNFWTPYPEHLWGQLDAADLLEAEISSRMPVGWGAYVIEEWVPGNNIRMRKNENYFRANEGLPLFDTVVFRMVGENPNANIAKILSGECDIVDRTSQLAGQSELLLELQTIGQVDPEFVTEPIFEHVDFGILPSCSQDGSWSQCLREGRPNFFGDVRVRQAIAMCIDRQAIVDTVLFGQSVVLDTYVPPDHPLFNPDVVRFPYDPQAAAALLDEAGWLMGEDGVRLYTGEDTTILPNTRLSFRYSTTSSRQQVAQQISLTLAQCGIDARPDYLPVGEFFAAGPDALLIGRNFDLAQYNWPTGIEPPCSLWTSDHIPGEDLEQYPLGLNGLNYPGYSNTDFDVACSAATQSLFGQEGYRQNHLLAQEIFAAELPVIPLYLTVKLAATRPDMCNFIMDPTALSEMWNIEAFDYGEACVE